MGNPLNYRGYTFGWRGKQLATASNGTDTLSFEYNEDGLRQQKTVNNVDTDYFYNGSVLIGMQQGTDVLRFSYDASGNVVSVDFNGTEYYYLRNAQGDVVKLIDGSGVVVVEYTYDTWGKKVTTTGTLAGTLGLIQPFRYRGYVYDEETGLYYLQSRYYDPTTGRFVSADVLLSTGQGVLGHNAYAYCLDDPANMFDDGGERSRRLTGRTEKEDGSGGVVNGGGSINDSSAPCGNGVPHRPHNGGIKSSETNHLAFDSNQQAVIELAKGYARGITESDANILIEWATEYGLNARGPEIHINRSGWASIHRHIHVGPLNHILVLGK